MNIYKFKLSFFGKASLPTMAASRFVRFFCNFKNQKLQKMQKYEKK